MPAKSAAKRSSVRARVSKPTSRSSPAVKYSSSSFAPRCSPTRRQAVPRRIDCSSSRSPCSVCGAMSDTSRPNAKFRTLRRPNIDTAWRTSDIRRRRANAELFASESTRKPNTGSTAMTSPRSARQHSGSEVICTILATDAENGEAPVFVDPAALLPRLVLRRPRFMSVCIGQVGWRLRAIPGLSAIPYVT